MSKYPNHLLKLIESLRKLPGVGQKSAERFAFQMLGWSDKQIKELAVLIHTIPEHLTHCTNCGCLADQSASCHFCTARTQPHTLCVIASARDAFAIEETREYKGLYHVLGGVLSPLDGFGPEKLNMQRLLDRLYRERINEVILALDSTVEGDATSLYIKQELEPLKIAVTRLAFGLPMGSSLDYVDGGTLARAFSGRGRF